jgi:hypothetical protein
VLNEGVNPVPRPWRHLDSGIRRAERNGEGIPTGHECNSRNEEEMEKNHAYDCKLEHPLFSKELQNEPTTVDCNNWTEPSEIEQVKKYAHTLSSHFFKRIIAKVASTVLMCVQSTERKTHSLTDLFSVTTKRSPRSSPR